YHAAWKNEFSVERDIHQIHGESNIFRYLPVKKMVLRVLENDNLIDLLMVLTAAECAGVKPDVSCAADSPFLPALKEKVGKKQLVTEDTATFAARMDQYERVRVTSEAVPDALLKRAAETGVYIANRRPLTEGLLELIHYVREQSVTYEYHRYGNIVEDAK
ncbi:MAG: proline dehydrogenase, partial [Bacteroidales bacterium]|nr:proline dehydrogenase [Bacteroidales bacterium]